MKIFKCNHCGNAIVKIEDMGVSVICCGEEMNQLVANTVDASNEKHVPKVEHIGEDVTVLVGEILHPMEKEHYIKYIVLETDKGFEIKYLNPEEEPIAKFKTNNKLIAVYEYCNLHGLWKTEL